MQQLEASLHQPISPAEDERGEAHSINTVQVLHQALKIHWGYDRFRALQLETIEAILNQQDSITLLPTGGGKSLCYQLPMILKPGETALIISPLIALMEDQVNQAREKGFKAACLTSSQGIEERKATFEAYRKRELQLLYVSPERVLRPEFLEALQAHGTIAYIAIDEAHCISQWGHQFRPEYQQLGHLRSYFPKASVHAFTATAPIPVVEDIERSLNLKEAQRLQASMYRSNLCLKVEERHRKKIEFLEEQLLPYLLRKKGQCGLIYCLSRAQVEEIATLLQTNGIKARGYHAGMAATLRQKNQQAFMSGEVQVMVATLAFGMGIDRSDIRFVVHTHAPKALEQYVQEAGRAGRDGLPSECILYTSPNDFYTWEKMMKQDEAGESFQRSVQRLWHLQQYTESSECRHRMVLDYFGQHLTTGYTCTGCDYCGTHPTVMEEAPAFTQHVCSVIWRLAVDAKPDTVLGVLCAEASLIPIGVRETAMALASYGAYPQRNKSWVFNGLLQLERYQFIALHTSDEAVGTNASSTSTPHYTLTREAMAWLRSLKHQDDATAMSALPPLVYGMLEPPRLLNDSPIKVRPILPNARPKPVKKKKRVYPNRHVEH
jgi:ATP-dependent DNA helicase RecQ